MKDITNNTQAIWLTDKESQEIVGGTDAGSVGAAIGGGIGAAVGGFFGFPNVGAAAGAIYGQWAGEKIGGSQMYADMTSGYSGGGSSGGYSPNMFYGPGPESY